MRIHIKFFSLLCIGILSGCSSTPVVKPGASVPSEKGTVRFNLSSKGQLLVAQKLRKGYLCEEQKGKLSVSAKPDGEPLPLNFVSSCTLYPSHITFITKESAPVGNYLVQIRREGLAKPFVGTPVVSAKYADPDFNSSTDFTVDGAKDLAEGQNTKGTVSFPNGNPSDWIRIRGKSNQVGLLLIVSDSDAAESGLQAQVFDYPPGSHAPRPLGFLTHKKKRVFSLKNDNLVVRVSTKDPFREADYTLIRSDAAAAGAGGKLVSIPVIDCYPITENSSLVLLRAVGGLKVADEVSVFGKRTGGEKVSLGTCSVVSVASDQVSCRLERAVGSQYVGYSAEGKVKGTAGSAE